MHGVKKILKQFEKLNLPEYTYSTLIIYLWVRFNQLMQTLQESKNNGIDVLNNLTIMQLQHLEVEN